MRAVSDLQISVHVLAEFVFCQRAAINAFLDDRPDEERAPILRLDYQPSYELHELQNRMEDLGKTIFRLSLVASTFFAAGLLLGYLVNAAIFLGGLAATIVVGRSVVRDIWGVIRLWQDYQAAEEAFADEPNIHVQSDEPVDWWSLLAAGFSSQKCHLPLADVDLRLIGRPWRILRRGNLAIPAYVRNTKQELKPQQKMRIVAYCHLIRQCQGADAPYGIILDPGTFGGTAVKASHRDMPLLRSNVNLIRRIIIDFLRHGQKPDPPLFLTVCHKCQHGCPRRVRIGKSETRSLGRVVPTFCCESRENEQEYHSNCGDRFAWLPHHGRADELKLR